MVQVIDLSGRKLAEQQLQQAQRMEAIGRPTDDYDKNDVVMIL